MKSQLFFSISELLFNKNFIYLLGLIWADGYLKKDRNQISVSMIESDMLLLLPIFQSIGNWWICRHKPNLTNRQWQIRIGITNKELYRFLVENDYLQKSIESPTKILKIIPNELQEYFWRGIIDGDGCFIYNAKHKSCKHSFSITGNYNQNWSDILSWLSQLKIPATITKIIHKEGNRGSAVVVQKSEHIKYIGDFIYKNYLNDKIGLDRKYQKYILISENVSRPKTSPYKFVWANKSGKFCYDFQSKGIRYFKSGFLSAEEAFEKLCVLRKSLGLNPLGKKSEIINDLS